MFLFFFPVCPGHPRVGAKGPHLWMQLKGLRGRPGLPLWPLPSLSLRLFLPFSLFFCVLSALHRVVVTRSVRKACEIVFRHSHNHTCPLKASGRALRVHQAHASLLPSLHLLSLGSSQPEATPLSCSDSLCANERKGGLGGGERGSERASEFPLFVPFVSLFVCRSLKLCISIRSSSRNLRVACAVCSAGLYFVVLCSVVSGFGAFRRRFSGLDM